MPSIFHMYIYILVWYAVRKKIDSINLTWMAIPFQPSLTQWGRMTQICEWNLTINGSDNGLPPGQHQAIIWINVGILSIGPLGTNPNEILIEIYTYSFMKMHLKMPSRKWWPFCLGLDVLNHVWYIKNRVSKSYLDGYTMPTVIDFLRIQPEN